MNDAQIDDRFFNFSPATLAAIHEYHRVRNPALIRPIFEGIMAKYLPEGTTPVAELADAPGGASFNAFGLESLTLLEVVLDLQDALDIRLADDELRGLHDLREAHALLVAKVDALRRGELPRASAIAPAS